MDEAAKAIEIDTPHGPARAHLHRAGEAQTALVLGHGAGGGVEAPDLAAATRSALDAGVSVALVEQPYRVAGRRTPPAASRLDACWIAAVAELAAGELAGMPLIAGGRSLGARVACRTVDEVGAVAVLCLAFPFQPRPRKGKAPPPSRIAELDAVAVPTLVVQGESDQFGIPPPGPRREVVEVAGDHGLKADPDAVAEAVGRWLAERGLRELARQA